MDEHCAPCLSSVSYYSSSDSGPSEQECHELFHQPCPACSLVDPQQYAPCGHCQHLRLRHLIKCVDPVTRNRFLFTLRKGLAEDANVTECRFCRLINHMIVAGLSPAQLLEVRAADYEIVLYPGLPQDSQSERSDAFSAEIWAHYPEDGGVATMWIGDLHIDDAKIVPTASPVNGTTSWVSLLDRIEECYETHSECQRKRSLPPGFRVIDVHRRCIVETSSCRFAALSYVWGPDPQPALLKGTRATIDDMKKDGGLPTSTMPKTIEDAIEICVRMGEKYLWADRLCIIQDDPDDKKNQIVAMGEIYSSAHIVLVAAYGDNMDFGIPGMRVPRKPFQNSENILDLRVTNVIRDVKDDPLNLWATRGWTYQESVLSHRRLYFTDTRAFFECERLICHEDQFNLEESLNELFSTRLVISEDRSRFQSFTRHLRHYTSRNLTYRSDAHNALYGISTSLYKGSGAFISGLPVADFDRALLWYPDIGGNAIQRLECQGEVLPTWSWLSVMGLSDPVHYRASEFYGTLAPWYHIDGSVASAGSVAVLNAHPDSEPDDDWQVYMAIATKEGCVRSVSLPFSLTTENFTAVRKLFNTRWQDYRSFLMEAIPITIEITELPQAIGTGTGRQGIIATKSLTVHLRLTPRSSSSFHIIDTEGDIVGGLCGDVTNLREQVNSSDHKSSTEFEFVALSLSGIRPYSEDFSRKSYCDSDGNWLKRIPIVNVLMIATTDVFACRRELGWIYLRDWARLQREWKVIVFE